MNTEPGATIGPYTITREIGRGGMGVVYLARDPKLDRDVAIKALPEELLGDEDRLARFEREAKLLASLSHGNIASVYGLEEANNQRYLVMEYIEGEDLSERLKLGAIPVDEALEIAVQIAHALEAAHDKGIIHRDLKPANIKLTPDGDVKVLDFGLAKALSDDASTASGPANSPTIIAGGSATLPGVVLGTAGYLSPEQARGRPVDKRTDIFSFGCVLYEMLAGQYAFPGENATDSIGASLHVEVNWNALPSGTPPTVQLLLRRCLAKDRKRRLHDIADARLEIENAIADPTSSSLGLAGVALAADARHREPRALQRSLSLVLAVILTAVVVSTAFLGFGPAPSQQPLRKYEIAAGPVAAGWRSFPVISPDGTKIAYAHREKIWIRELAKLETQEVAGSNGATTPFWSPDSDFLVYEADGKFWKIAAFGGGPTLICELPDRQSIIGASWGDDNRIVFSSWRGPMYEVSAMGGDPKVLIPLAEDEIDFHRVQHLPDGKGLLFNAHKKDSASGEWLEKSSIELFSEGNRRVILGHESGLAVNGAVYSHTGHLLFYRSETNTGIWAVQFSLSKLDVIGEPFMVVSSAIGHSVSTDGTLTYIHEDKSLTIPISQLSWFDRTGKVLAPIGPPARHWLFPDISPDETLVVATIGENADERDVWVYDATNESPRPPRRVTFQEDKIREPVWSPKGDRIVFTKYFGNFGETLYEASENHRSEPTSLTSGMYAAFSPDGKFLVYTLMDSESLEDLWYLPLEPRGSPISFLQTSALELGGRISPDGGLIAYMAAEEDFDAMEVYIEPFPAGGERQQVSVAGGFWPRWSKDGKKLYYVEAPASSKGSPIDDQLDHLMEVEVDTEPPFNIGEPRRLFSINRLYSGDPLPVGFDVAADGQRFVIAQPLVTTEDKQPQERGITIVQNWIAQFEASK